MKPKDKSKKHDKKRKDDADISERELENLRQKNIHGDGGDDQQLRERQKDVDFSGEDLDVPKPDSTKKKSGKELKDEENHLYSEGGERNENLERDDSTK